MSRSVRRYITVVAAVAATTVAFSLVGLADGVERPGVALLFVTLLILGERLPLFMWQFREGEGLSLAEVFLVAMLFLLPPAEVLGAFVLGVSIGELSRRPGAWKLTFNTAQLALAATVAIHVADLSPGLGPSPWRVITVLAAAACYFVINNGLVSVVVGLAQGLSPWVILERGLRDRAFVWTSNVSLGLLMGLTSAAHLWALPLSLVPVVMLHLAFSAHMREKRASERMDGLFRTAVEAHSSMGIAAVERALTSAAAERLRCSHSRLRSEPPDGEQLGVVLHATYAGTCWLVVWGRQSGDPFDDADRRLLEAIAAVGASALDNAVLYKRVADERQKMSDVVSSSSDGIFTIDRVGRVQSWNPAMERIAGVPAAAVIGRRVTDVLGPGAGGSLLGPQREVQVGHPVAVQIATGEGERWLACSLSELPEGGHVVVARDVTAQREVDELKADFLATVSHELRTPLTPIKGFLDTLRQRGDQMDDAQRSSLYEVMAQQAHRLERLVKDLLDATVVERTSPLFLIEELDWARVVGETVDLYRRQEPDRDFDLTVPDGLPRVLADEGRAAQVLTNLLSNAVKYSPEGVPVSIVVEHAGPTVVTRVVDRGPGVPVGDRERIFDRFTRLGNYSTRSSGGAGLGLFIARGLVEGMGGRIWVDAATGGGATFSFEVQVAQPVEAAQVDDRSAARDI